MTFKSLYKSATGISETRTLDCITANPSPGSCFPRQPESLNFEFGQHNSHASPFDSLTSAVPRMDAAMAQQVSDQDRRLLWRGTVFGVILDLPFWAVVAWFVWHR